MNHSDLHAPGKTYYAHTRLELVALLDGVPQTVLEVGCGRGNTLRHLKERGARETFGIELNSSVAEDAIDQVDHVAVGDVESMPWPFPGARFDCIILGDVLEHLRDPWGVVETLKDSLYQGGQIVASLPNVRFYGVSIPLLLGGKWTYTEAGILDRTHLRFFTRRTAIQLFAQAGLEVRHVGSTYGPKRRLFNLLTVGIFRNLLARQHLIHAVKVE
jgi:SAM-dependent methyltransferase